MKHWAFVTAACYAALLVLLTAPVLSISGFVSSPRDLLELYQQWGYWLWLGVLVLCQLSLLLVPVRAAERRPIARRHLSVTVGATAFLLANLLWAGLGAFLSGIFGDHASEPLERFGEKSVHSAPLVHVFALLHVPLPDGLTFTLLSIVAAFVCAWAIWFIAFYRFARSHGPESLMHRATKWLLRGSILELLVAVPSHLIVRRRDDCCARAGTFWGIATGISVMLIAFGPAIFFLFSQRIQGLRPRSIPVEPLGSKPGNP